MLLGLADCVDCFRMRKQVCCVNEAVSMRTDLCTAGRRTSSTVVRPNNVEPIASGSVGELHLLLFEVYRC